MEIDVDLDGIFTTDEMLLTGLPIPYQLEDTGNPLFDDFFQSYGYAGGALDEFTSWTHGWTLQDFRTFLRD
jgi:hypothetical protein